MSAAPQFLFPRSGQYLVRESPTTEDLTTNIRNAVESTVAGITVSGERDARRFFARADREQILNPTSLAQLFRELLAKYPEYIDALSKRPLSTQRSERRRSSTASDPGDLIDALVRATIHDQPRTALLALFLYQDRELLLLTFLQWMLCLVTDSPPGGHAHVDIDVPTDDSMPFTQSSLADHGIAQRFHWEILRTQAIFKPVNIRKNQHQELSTADRLPFIGVRAKSKAGSSGTVSETTIARMHWEIMSEGQSIIGNPHDNRVVALKTFEEIPIVRDMKMTTQEFMIERGILQDLRSRNTKHDMIMLDWGSITILDEVGNPLRHSLIFELATFSLHDFLADERRARVYTKQSLLLARLVDLVEALAVLHDSLGTLHLDIKPDNILVFERGSSSSDNQNQDQDELVFKISDFGLARKIGTRQRTGHNQIDMSYQRSRSSATSATRPAGAYQGPEIQQQDSSCAGRGSDVWSIGCVALMMLAFVTGGPIEVSKLTNRLPVDFLGRDGRQSLFYIRSDSHPWKSGDVDHYPYQYLKHFKPVIGRIPWTQPQLQAAVNPQVIVWSNVLYDSYDGDSEQHFIQRWFEAIFCSALLIDHSQRAKAAELHKTLRRIQQDWQAYENNSEVAVHNHIITSHSSGFSTSHHLEPTTAQSAYDSTATPQAHRQLHSQQSHVSRAPMIAITASPGPASNAVLLTPPASPLRSPINNHDTLLDGGKSAAIPPLGAPLLPVATASTSLDVTTSVESPPPQAAPLRPGIASTQPEQVSDGIADTPLSPAAEASCVSSLCSAIKANDADAVRRELGDGNERLKERCPGTNTYPVHCALKYRTYDALAVLLEKADPDIMDLECGGRTALEMACDDGGFVQAFRCFQRYSSSLRFPEDVYKENKKELGTDAGRAFDELYAMVNSGKKKKKKKSSWTMKFGGR